MAVIFWFLLTCVLYKPQVVDYSASEGAFDVIGDKPADMAFVGGKVLVDGRAVEEITYRQIPLARIQ